MEGCSIRPFKDEDIDFAYKLDVMEQWDHTRDDIKRVLGFEPNGCFIAEIGGEPVGHVFSISYGRLGWIGFLIVKTEYRRRGIGTLLMKRAIDYLLSRKANTIKLEAVPIMANLYRKLGFVDEFDSLRFIRIGGKISSVSSHCVKLLKKREIAELAEFDAGYFGANRIRVLNGLYQDNPQLCFVSRNDSEIVGYAMCYEAESGHRIGPWVCNPENLQVARELLTKCIETIGRNEKLYIGVPAVNERSVEILRDLGFEQCSKSIRMYLGKKLEIERVDGLFAIGGPEKG
jgi:ribosomal protein S18 acetylase RimI-like enzyme